MKVLVTGANGFVGGVLCTRLSVSGYEVCGAVRRAGTVSQSVSEEVVVGSVGPDTDWVGALRNVGCVVHLAARAHVMRDSDFDAEANFKSVNVDGTKHLAEQAAAAGVRRFVYVSSIKVNGEETRLRPFSEVDRPAPEDAYGRSKLEAERVLFDVANATGMELVVVRPPLIYGPGVKGNMARLMNWMARGYPLPFGAIRNCRSLIALDNLVDLLVCCLEHPDAAGQVFLAADGTDMSTPGLIRSLAKGGGHKSILIPLPPVLLRLFAKIIGRDGDVRRLVGSLQVDASKARSMLGWQPPVAPDQALSEMAQWYKRCER